MLRKEQRRGENKSKLQNGTELSTLENEKEKFVENIYVIERDTVECK